ncbi:hypothetical protein [Pseudomonas sp. microsymbiont 2]
MPLENIARFNEMTGKIFACLYLSFPVPTSLWPNATGVEAKYVDGITADCPPSLDNRNDFDFFHSTVGWLITTGYLTADRDDQKNVLRGYNNAVLTAKGLEVLQATPDSLKPSESLGDKLANASKSGAKEILRSTTEIALGIGVKLLTQRLGLP